MRHPTKPFSWAGVAALLAQEESDALTEFDREWRRLATGSLDTRAARASVEQLRGKLGARVEALASALAITKRWVQAVGAKQPTVKALNRAETILDRLRDDAPQDIVPSGSEAAIDSGVNQMRHDLTMQARSAPVEDLDAFKSRLIAEFQDRTLTEERRIAALNALRDKVNGLRARDVVEIARIVTNRPARSAKAALEDLERWTWGVIQGREQQKRWSKHVQSEL